MRCGRCGNENAEGNRFCGMCGAALAAKDQAAPPASSRDAEARTAPVITGPSFLGLNTPAPERDSRRARLKEDLAAEPHDPLRPSENVDYLLEDDDEPRRGWGKPVLLVVALALAVGFGYLHWKRGGFDWLSAANKKPTAATAPTEADSGSAATTPAPSAPQAGSGTAPVANGSASRAESDAPPSMASQTSAPPISQSASQTPPSQSAPAPANAPAQTATPQSAEQQSAGPSNAGEPSPAPSGSQAADSDAEKQAPPAATPTKTVVRKPAATKTAVPKPSPVKSAAAKTTDLVSEAEGYIYGRGVGQDCDRGLRLLKSATEQSNVKAMVSMGVLYSTGTCTPRDLPTAYRWFATALHKEPDNQALQDDLQNLWGKMTPPERQLAIKLSQ